MSVDSNSSSSSISSSTAKERKPVLTTVSSNTHRTNKYHLSRFSRWYDILFMTFGSVLAISAGVCLPIIYYLIGRAITEFSDYTISVEAIESINQSLEYFCDVSNDTVLLTSDEFFNQVSFITYYIIGLSLGLFLLTTLSNMLWTFSALNRTKRIRKALLKSVLTKDVEWYDINSPYALSSLLIEDTQRIEDGSGSKVANFIKEFTTLVSGLVIAFILNWRITLVVFGFIPLLVLGIIFLGKILGIVTNKERSYLACAGAIAEEAFILIKTIIAFEGERKEEERYSNILKEAKKFSFKKQLTIGFITGFFSFIIFAVYGLGIWYGAIVLSQCNVTSGTIFTILFEVAGGCLHINEALPLLSSIIGASSAKSAVYSIIDQKSQKQLKQTKKLGNIEGHITFSNVTFSYPSRPEVPVLNGLTLSVKPGQTLALVGPSGSGKSTVLQLLQSTYKPNKGMITIDGIDSKDIDEIWLRNQIGIVSQEPILFNISIRENILYGKQDATQSEIDTATKSANAYDFIKQLPNGYDTLVGDGGAQLSGGQKQRIAIARALIRNPKILLLDEATSALDTESEKVVQEALDKARVGRTTIIIAHRISTIYNADVIATINNGQVEEMGSHNELIINEGGLYCQLVHCQIKDEQEIRNDDFNQAYRKSIKRQKSKRLTKKLSNPPLPSISEQRRHSSKTAPANAPLKTEKSFLRSIPRRVSENLITVAEIPNSPVNLASAHMSSFDEDDVFVWPDELSYKDTSKTKANPVPWSTLIQLSRPDWWLIVIGMIGFILVGILLSAIYVLISGAVEVFATTDRTELLHSARYYFILYIGCGLGTFVLHFISFFCLGLASDRLTSRLREQTFRAIMKQDMSFFDEPEGSVSILTQRLTIDATQVNQVTGVLMGVSIRGIVNVIAGFIIALHAVWTLGLISLLSIIVFVGGGALQLKLTHIYTVKSYMCKKESNRTAVEAIDNVYTVSSLGIHERILQKYHKQLREPYWYDIKVSIVEALFYAFLQSFLVILMAAMLNLGALFYTLDESSIFYADTDRILRAAGVMLLTSLIFNEIYRGLPDTQSARIAANNILNLLTRDHRAYYGNETGVVMEAKDEPSTVQFRQVEFSYPSRPDTNILRKLSIVVKPGTTLALVGPSGSGKSTVIALIERFYDVSRGSLALDTVDLHEINVSSLRRQMSLVSQEPDLFDMSIADNICYGALYREVSEEEIVQAAKDANIHEFIVTLPQGYQTNVGSKGTQLSGGQKQRIAIARALIRNPKILLLDEATSALDTESEKVVQEALDKARVGRTTIIIAHRLSTIYNADVIAVLHRGRVVEQGTHSELMKKKGAYYFMNQINKEK